MYRTEQVEGFSETLAKVRKAVHKFFPREASPTRLAEKYGSDQKKKGAKKIAAAAATSAAHAQAGDELLRAQLAKIQAALPATLAAPDVPTPAPRRAAAPVNVMPWLLGAGALGLVLLGRKKR